MRTERVVPAETIRLKHPPSAPSSQLLCTEHVVWGGEAPDITWLPSNCQLQWCNWIPQLRIVPAGGEGWREVCCAPWVVSNDCTVERQIEHPSAKPYLLFNQWKNTAGHNLPRTYRITGIPDRFIMTMDKITSSLHWHTSAEQLTEISV